MTFDFKVISKGIGIADLESVLFPDEGEEDEADERRRVFEELASRPDWRSVW